MELDPCACVHACISHASFPAEGDVDAQALEGVVEGEGVVHHRPTQQLGVAHLQPQLRLVHHGAIDGGDGEETLVFQSSCSAT